jgi:hypothetical protein
MQLQPRSLVTAVLVLLAVFPLRAQTCPNTTIASDQDVWNANSSMSRKWYRDMSASFYNMQKDDWDGSWGWAKYNDANPYRWEMPKVMSSGQVLWSGLEDTPSMQGAWAGGSLTATTGTVVSPPRFSAVSRTENSIDVVYRDALGRVRHIALSGSPWDPGSAASTATETIVSDVVATDKNSFRVSDDIALVKASSNRLDVFARQGNGLLHFQWTAAGGWTAADPTNLVARPTPSNGQSRYFITSRPIAVRRSGVTIVEVFARDAFAHLIRYSLDAGGIWSAEDVSERIAGVPRVSGMPAIATTATGLDVFSINTSRELEQFHRNDDGSWTHRNVTREAETAKRVTGTPAVLDLGASTIGVFARGTNGEFLVYYWLPPYGWFEVDETQEVGPIESDPVAVQRKAFSYDVFALGINNNLIHHYWSSEIGTEDLTNKPGFETDLHSIAGRPSAIAVDGDRVDVFAAGFLTGHMIHYYWTPSLGWQSENLHGSTGLSLSFERMAPFALAISRRPNALDVFAGREDLNNRIIAARAVIGRSMGPWHTTLEYSDWASGDIHDYKYIPENGDDDVTANALRGAFVTDRVAIQCPGFALDAGDRAGTMLHESTHMIFWRFSHQSNPPGSNCDDPCADDWFFHGVGAGKLVHNPSKNHSMNQIKIEFLCDLAEFPRWDLPVSASSGASTSANSLMINRIRNPPAWSCGTPRPLP